MLQLHYNPLINATLQQRGQTMINNIAITRDQCRRSPEFNSFSRTRADWAPIVVTKKRLMYYSNVFNNKADTEKRCLIYPVLSV